MSLNTDTENQSLLPFNDIETRIIGCLIEKQHTTPNQYPLTLNSLQLACNQKTSRNPTMDLAIGELGACVNQLIDKGVLVKNPFSVRAEKYEHKLDRLLGLSEPRLAILCVLMLRADQTMAEIKTHTQRIYGFTDLNEVKAHIEALQLKEPALVIELPKKAGTKEVRYMHLLAGDIDLAVYAKTPVSHSISRNQTIEALEARIDTLETRLSAIESLLGSDNENGENT